MPLPNGNWEGKPSDGGRAPPFHPNQGHQGPHPQGARYHDPVQQVPTRPPTPMPAPTFRTAVNYSEILGNAIEPESHFEDAWLEVAQGHVGAGHPRGFSVNDELMNMMVESAEENCLYIPDDAPTADDSLFRLSAQPRPVVMSTAATASQVPAPSSQMPASAPKTPTNQSTPPRPQYLNAMAMPMPVISPPTPSPMPGPTQMPMVPSNMQGSPFMGSPHHMPSFARMPQPLSSPLPNGGHMPVQTTPQHALSGNRAQQKDAMPNAINDRQIPTNGCSGRSATTKAIPVKEPRTPTMTKTKPRSGYAVQSKNALTAQEKYEPKPNFSNGNNMITSAAGAAPTSSPQTPDAGKVPKKRGRPRKHPLPTEAASELQNNKTPVPDDTLKVQDSIEVLGHPESSSTKRSVSKKRSRQEVEDEEDWNPKKKKTPAAPRGQKKAQKKGP